MSQIFLVTLDQVNPLPLYAFSLPKEERIDPQYAIRRKIAPIMDESLQNQYPAWKSLIHNRCSDLLVVADQTHLCHLGHSVEFLHRSIRNFLEENYRAELLQNVAPDFDSKLSLMKIWLVLLKSLLDETYRDQQMFPFDVFVTY